MRAVVRVDVTNRKQARDIEAGLALPDVRAFALAMGVLDRLPSDRARARVLNYLREWIADPDAWPKLGAAAQAGAAAPDELPGSAEREP